MQVRQPEVMGAVDDDCVGIGDVEAALDDGCGDEHIVVVVHKIHHHLLKLLWRHLAVCYCHTSIRHMLADKFGKLG